MTLHYRDRDGDLLIIDPGRDLDGQPVLHFATTPEGVDIPLDRIEELVAGIRDTARQAATSTDPRHCAGFPETCPNLLNVAPNPPEHHGGLRCGCRIAPTGAHA